MHSWCQRSGDLNQPPILVLSRTPRRNTKARRANRDRLTKNSKSEKWHRASSSPAAAYITHVSLVLQLYFRIIGVSCRVDGWINVSTVICLSLLHNDLPFSPGPLSAVLPCATQAEVWHNSPDISHKAHWPWCCCCHAWCCSVLRRPQPWENEALRNVGKYSFGLTPFLPLSDSTATPPLLLNLEYTTAVALGSRRPRALRLLQVWSPAPTGSKKLNTLSLNSSVFPLPLPLCVEASV